MQHRLRKLLTKLLNRLDRQGQIGRGCMLGFIDRLHRAFKGRKQTLAVVAEHHIELLQVRIGGFERLVNRLQRLKA